MPTVNGASLRAQMDDCRARFDAVKRTGEAGAETRALIDALFLLPDILVAVFLEKTTRKTSANSGLPPSQTGEGRDRPAYRQQRQGREAEPADGRQPPEDRRRGDGRRRCLRRLRRRPVRRRSRRPGATRPLRHRVRGRRASRGCRGQGMPRLPGPDQGAVPRNHAGPAAVRCRASGLCRQPAHRPHAVPAPGRCAGAGDLRPGLSEATCLGCVRRLHDALEAWEEAAIEHLPARPALHADETGFRVDGRNQRLHVLADGSPALKFLHPKRGREAVDETGVIPRCAGVLIHDCRATCFACGNCRHQLCGSHLLRELAFVFESSGIRWARLMRKLLREACHAVNRSTAKTPSEAERRAIRKRCRTIPTRGGKELPEIPPRPKGKRGRIAKSDDRNLHERLAKHEESVLRFMGDPDVSFTNNAGERKIRMAKVKIKVSGCFRTRLHADAWCRISSCPSSMAALGCNPLVAIQIALAGKAADMIKIHYPHTPPTKRGEQLPQ